MQADENKPILDYDKQVCYSTVTPDADRDHFEKNINSEYSHFTATTARRVICN